MSPRSAAVVSEMDKKNDAVGNLLQLSNIKKAIPTEAFKKSLLWSLFYLILDYSILLGSVFAIKLLNESPLWNQMNFLSQSVASVLFWNISGFYMWCIFVVGHDCGHTNFSNYWLLNDVIGHITHGSILVPYYPWQLSHRRHHMYHNHIDKDYSHPWYTEQTLQKPAETVSKLLHEMPMLRFFSPCYGWWLYLVGKPDGSHIIPFPDQRMWKESPKIEQYKCILSTAVCCVYLYGFIILSGYSFPTLAYYYLAPLSVFGWWLVTVTYLQHHNPETVVYNDADWKFVDAAFETVDRKFGYGIDTLSHHITDGHLAHHLFFTSIPHYNLPLATKAIREYLVKNNLQSIYKSEKTYDFMFRVHMYFVQLGYKAKLFNEVPVLVEEVKKQK